MVNPYVMVSIDPGIHERLHRMKTELSERLRESLHQFGISATIGMLMDHWEQHQPEFGWIEETSALYPRRGRPRRSAAQELRVALKADPLRGHRFVRHQDSKDKHLPPWRQVGWCVLCGYLSNPLMNNNIKPEISCPFTDPDSNAPVEPPNKEKCRLDGWLVDAVEWPAP